MLAIAIISASKKLIPNNFFGRILFDILYLFENKFPRFFIKHFQYPIIILKKMISIVVVSLNTAKKFEKTIKSILNQSTNNFELIVVDGMSKDKTKYFLKKYNKFITKIISEKDKGIYDAMNKGIKNSSKKLIYFLNSGDIFCNKNILKKILNILKKKDS